MAQGTHFLSKFQLDQDEIWFAIQIQCCDKLHMCFILPLFFKGDKHFRDFVKRCKHWVAIIL